MKRIFSLLWIPFLLTACSNWLDVVPEEDITTIDSDFETREQAQRWHESCHVFCSNQVANFMENVGILGADELVYGNYFEKDNGDRLVGAYIGTGGQNSVNPYDDTWLNKVTYEGKLAGRGDYYTAINLCNVFIDKVDQVNDMENREKAEWKAEVKAMKAWYYFELVRRYGPIVLVPENIDPNVDVEVMKVPRSHVDTCFNHIVRLCDEAAEVLLPANQKESNRRTYFSKETALALKARALCYQASPLFNGNPDYANFKNKNGEPLFSAEYDKEKWKRAAEAADTAIQVCRDNGKRLINNMSASTELQTRMLNIENSVLVHNYTNDEVLWMVKMVYDSYNFWKHTLPRINSDNIGALTGTMVSPSMKMVEMFYTENGLPIDQDRTYGSGSIYNLTRETDPKYTDVVALDEDILYLHTRREPRFYADIAADRCYWRLGRTVQSNRKVTAYQGEDFGLKAKRLTGTVPENVSGYWVKKWTNSKCDLFTYAGSVSALGTACFPVMRVAELYLIAAEAWNEYEGPTKDPKHVYGNLNKIRERAGIPDVEVSWALARDRDKVNTKEGMRDIIRQEWNIEYAFEGYRFWNLRRWKTAPVELNGRMLGWNVVGSNNKTFFNNGNGPVPVGKANKFVAPRDYFWPIRSEEVTTSGCVQNLGW